MEGTLLNTITFPEFTDLVRRNFTLLQNMVPMKARQLFIYDRVGQGQGKTKSYDEYDVETFASNKAEGAPASKARTGVGYQKIMTKKRIAKEVDITYEMRTENRYAQVRTEITSLSHFVPQRIELDLTHRLTFCSSTSYTDKDGDTVDTTTGDGLQLVYNAHTLKHSSTTYSNRVTGDPLFSRGGIEAAENLAVSNILSNFGERRVMMFNSIITSDDPNTCNSVKQFLSSTSDVDQNNPGVINVYEGSYRHIKLPYLATTATGARDATKRQWWFLASIGLGTMGWQAYYGEWEAPHLNDTPKRGSNAEDVHTDTWTYGVRGGYGICTVSPRGLIGSLPTSS